MTVNSSALLLAFQLPFLSSSLFGGSGCLHQILTTIEHQTWDQSKSRVFSSSPLCNFWNEKCSHGGLFDIPNLKTHYTGLQGKSWSQPLLRFSFWGLGLHLAILLAQRLTFWVWKEKYKYVSEIGKCFSATLYLWTQNSLRGQKTMPFIIVEWSKLNLFWPSEHLFVLVQLCLSTCVLWLLKLVIRPFKEVRVKTALIPLKRKGKWKLIYLHVWEYFASRHAWLK